MDGISREPSGDDGEERVRTKARLLGGGRRLLQYTSFPGNQLAIGSFPRGFMPSSRQHAH